MDDRLLIYGMVLVLLIGFGIRAAIDYKDYKGTIYQYLYDNYLIDYYWHYYIRKDNSRSSLLQEEIGNHRLIHARISDQTGEVLCRFVSIIHTHGITVICYMNPHGKLTGKANDKNWLVQRRTDDLIKNYRIVNPVPNTESYVKHLMEVTGAVHVDVMIAIGGEDEIKLSIPWHILRYVNLMEAIKESDAGYVLSSSEIEDAFRKLSEGK